MKEYTTLVKCSDFVKRQTKDSGYSHFVGTWEELEQMVMVSLATPDNIHSGYKDGVCLVDMPAQWFFSAIVSLNKDSKLKANFAPRQVGEAPFIRICSAADKQRAKYASVVLYRHDVLAEDNDRSTDAKWEIIAIKARVSKEEDPMDPYTMARNFLHLKGGTKASFTAEEFAKSIVYWNNHCMTQSKKPWWRFWK